MSATAHNYAQASFMHTQNALHLQYIGNRLSYSKFNLLYLNINSLLNKLDDLEFTITELNNKNTRNIIHFIALTEIRLHDYQIPYFNIQSYTPYYCTRNDGYGGCALFVHSSLNSNLVESKSVHNIELLTVKINDLALNITVVYKQPLVNNDLFTNTLHSFIQNKKK